MTVAYTQDDIKRRQLRGQQALEDCFSALMKPMGMDVDGKPSDSVAASINEKLTAMDFLTAFEFLIELSGKNTTYVVAKKKQNNMPKEQRATLALNALTIAIIGTRFKDGEFTSLLVDESVSSQKPISITTINKEFTYPDTQDPEQTQEHFYVLFSQMQKRKAEFEKQAGLGPQAAIHSPPQTPGTKYRQDGGR